MPNREVVVVLRPPDVTHESFSAESPLESRSGSDLAKVLESFGASMRPMFDRTATPSPANPALERLDTDTAQSSEMDRYYAVDVGGADAEKLVEQLQSSELVETAYIKPAVELPIAPDSSEAGERPVMLRQPTIAARTRRPPVRPAPTAAVPAIPNYRARQIYLNAAPEGVDAAFAWASPGGKGTDIRIIDIEGGWQFSHLDLRANSGGIIGGAPINDVGWRNHGTAVLGEIGGDENTFGVVGIVPDAKLSAVSHDNLGSAAAIQHAANVLRAGDVLLLEMHRPGPRFNFQARNDQRGYIAVEWWPDDFLAIQYAASRGIIVIEAAGNGAENLDDPLYNVAGPNFPASWRNPFAGAVDSGAIVVGAGAPPPTTHGRNHGPDRSRLDFSNFGARLDCQAWGREVTTTGYGDLFGDQLSEDFWYTDTFSGTSSASPIVTGVVAALQGIAKKNGSLLTPAHARNLLRTHGSPQTDAPGRPATQRIGLRPDLRKLVPAMTAIA